MATEAISNDLVTEDDTPVDNFFSEKQQRLLTEPLYSSLTAWSGQRSFVVASNVGLFFAVRSPPLVPDALLSMDVDLPVTSSPRAIGLILSGNTASRRTWSSRSSPIARAGRTRRSWPPTPWPRIPYYAIFDPEKLLSAEVLRGYRLDGTEFHKMDEPLWFPGVGLGLRIWQGRYEEHDNTWLRWVDARGGPVPTGQERAEAERQRGERLAAQLRQLGVEPAE